MIAAVLVVTVGLVWLGPWSGEPAPEVNFTTLDGREINLADLRGQPVLVTFWATTCPGCVAEIPHLKNLYSELGPQGMELIAVAMSYDPPEQVAAMVEERDMFYPIVLDKDDRIANAFGDIRLTPTTVLIDPDGRIVWRRLGELDMQQVKRQIVGMLPVERAG